MMGHCEHPTEAREVVMLPNDDNSGQDVGQPIIMPGVRFCTACYTLIVHIGEYIMRLDIATGIDLT